MTVKGVLLVAVKTLVACGLVAGLCAGVVLTKHKFNGYKLQTNAKNINSVETKVDGLIQARGDSDNDYIKVKLQKGKKALKEVKKDNDFQKFIYDSMSWKDVLFSEESVDSDLVSRSDLWRLVLISGTRQQEESQQPQHNNRRRFSF